ncbi:MAG: hypothetical protein IKW39_06190 [Alphaproteobacteria bacterium]|nr:hypothetical protein [Alphaproteobacteria bacterium]
MRNFYFLAVLVTGCIFTACSDIELINQLNCTFDADKIEEQGLIGTNDGIISYVVSSGKNYETVLDNIVQFEPEKIDTLLTKNYLTLKNSYLLNPVYHKTIEITTQKDNIEKTKTVNRISVHFKCLNDKVPLYFVQQSASIKDYPMPYPELNYELKETTMEELPDVVTEDAEYYALKLSFTCEVQYEGITVPLKKDVVVLQKKVEIAFRPSVGDWNNHEENITM